MINGSYFNKKEQKMMICDFLSDHFFMTEANESAVPLCPVFHSCLKLWLFVMSIIFTLGSLIIDPALFASSLDVTIFISASWLAKKLFKKGPSRCPQLKHSVNIKAKVRQCQYNR